MVKRAPSGQSERSNNGARRHVRASVRRRTRFFRMAVSSVRTLRTRWLLPPARSEACTPRLTRISANKCTTPAVRGRGRNGGRAPEKLGSRDAIKTYRYLRVAMVGAVLLLAASIAIERSKVDCWQTSISA